MPLDRQVLLTAGLIVFVSVILGFTISLNWFFLTGLAGLGMVFSGFTGWCGLAKILSMMPWNQ